MALSFDSKNIIKKIQLILNKIYFCLSKKEFLNFKLYDMNKLFRLYWLNIIVFSLSFILFSCGGTTPPQKKKSTFIISSIELTQYDFNNQTSYDEIYLAISQKNDDTIRVLHHGTYYPLSYIQQEGIPFHLLDEEVHSLNFEDNITVTFRARVNGGQFSTLQHFNFNINSKDEDEVHQGSSSSPVPFVFKMTTYTE
jgi:hypothetical protein